jgi:hypothetical protein
LWLNWEYSHFSYSMVRKLKLRSDEFYLVAPVGAGDMEDSLLPDEDVVSSDSQAAEPLHSFIFGTTGAGSTYLTLLYERMKAGETFQFVDPKGSYTVISRRKAKKRLMAAGLRPSEANRLVASLAGSAWAGLRLREAMRHKRRSSVRWFPFDVTISARR